MQHLINKAVADIQISGIRKFSNLVARYDDAISLTIGQPDFPTPLHVKMAAQAAIDADRTTYTANAGLPTLRQAAARFLQHKYDLQYDANTEVIVTLGASEAIDITLRTILEPGCEVILPAPIYPGYEPLIRLAGATPIYVDTTSNRFLLNAALLEESLTERTRCVIIPSPSNPTGAVIPPTELAEIAELLGPRDVFVLSDEIYSELTYGVAHNSIAFQPGMRDKTIVINGLSKSHSMTGWRVGFAFAPAYLAEHMLKVHQYNVTCASSISQYAAVEALTNGIDDAVEMRQAYALRRDFVCSRLSEIGFDVIRPEGAFYVFPSIRPFQRPSFRFAEDLLEQTRVAVVPGDAFSPLGEGFVRISYACDMETLTEGLDRIERFVRSL